MSEFHRSNCDILTIAVTDDNTESIICALQRSAIRKSWRISDSHQNSASLNQRIKAYLPSTVTPKEVPRPNVVTPAAARSTIITLAKLEIVEPDMLREKANLLSQISAAGRSDSDSNESPDHGAACFDDYLLSFMAPVLQAGLSTPQSIVSCVDSGKHEESSSTSGHDKPTLAPHPQSCNRPPNSVNIPSKDESQQRSDYSTAVVDDTDQHDSSVSVALTSGIHTSDMPSAGKSRSDNTSSQSKADLFSAIKAAGNFRNSAPESWGTSASQSNPVRTPVTSDGTRPHAILSEEKLGAPDARSRTDTDSANDNEPPDRSPSSVCHINSAVDSSEVAKILESRSLDEPPLENNPDITKQYRMLNLGLSKGAAKNAAKLDKKDDSVHDVGPLKPLKSQVALGGSDELPLKDDPDYVKYFRMMKAGLPRETVQHAMKRDDKDGSILDLDPEKPLKSQMDEANDTAPPTIDDSEHAKYPKMLKAGVPKGAVQHAMQRDGKRTTIPIMDLDKSINSHIGNKDGDTTEDSCPPLQDDPEYAKYFKMLKIGLPIEAVKNALHRDGKDESIMDLDYSKSAKSQLTEKEKELKETEPSLKNDPDYSKYFKMLKLGLPREAVQHAMLKDGKDVSVLGLDPEKSLKSQKLGNRNVVKKGDVPKQCKVRRKRLFWDAVDRSELVDNTIWSEVKTEDHRLSMSNLEYNSDEFNDLFVATTAEPATSTENTRGTLSKAKKAVQVIDGKRGMNGGIVLARLKTDYGTMAKQFDCMDTCGYDATQLMALQSFLPTEDEARGLKAFVTAERKSKSDAEVFDCMCECEKFMWKMMMGVDNVNEKFDCMVFRSKFETRVSESLDDVMSVQLACSEVRNSTKLKKLLALVLTLGNKINDGGGGNEGVFGFRINTLIKLHEAKTFDTKSSILHYLVKLARDNDASLLTFDEEISEVDHAKRCCIDLADANLNKLSTEFQTLKTFIESDAKTEEDGDCQDNFHQSSLECSRQSSSSSSCHDDKYSMPLFVHEAESKLAEALQAVEEAKSDYQSLLHYFGEDEDLSSTDFFGTLQAFICLFQSAKEQVEMKEKAEEHKK